jgi:hypothetical protein
MANTGQALMQADQGHRKQRGRRGLDEEASRPVVIGSPAQLRAVNSLRLAQTELQRQASVTRNAGRREQILRALDDIERRIAEL